MTTHTAFAPRSIPGATPVRFQRLGYCIKPSLALEHPPTGRVHFIRARQNRMSACGFNSKNKPKPVRLVRNRLITCRRCLMVVFFGLSRDGELGR